MILFNQIGLDQTLLQKKAKVVFQVMDLLSKRSFHIETAQGRIMIFLTTINHRKEGYERFGDIRLLFNKKYLDAIAPLIELRQNVFLPKDLSDKLLRLEAALFDPKVDLSSGTFGKVMTFVNKETIQML